MTEPEAAQIIAERLDLYRKLLNAGVLTINVVRRYEGLKELPSKNPDYPRRR